ncbi:PRC-barrel domain-containing protein [Haliea sp. E1-2-M8]|uniref:PRC-barrel domain-containing protein n=1 Tax=Haliea sp. E1-2-M8 TaxID=3064706 RepID=UPI002717F73C|nr:PRC-barrel domain-containing protein [Haliea sp. E1-2-M8]MDO8861799.1 PRC-barrel domain-containing protein [Haliea sp. E1-2-M8]
MKKFTDLALAAAVASVTFLGSGIAAAQVPGNEADRGAVVTDPVVGDESGGGGEHEYPAIKSRSGFYAADLIGHRVQNRRSGKEVGQVSNLVIDKDGNVTAILVSRSDMKGGGQRNVAIDWDQMDRVVEGDDITLTIDMDEKALEALPEHAPN